MKRRNRFRYALLGVALLSPLTVPVVASAAARPQPTKQGAFSQPATALGAAWASSSDELVTATGDSAGYHVMVARESSAFKWTNLVTLVAPEIDTGPWTGEICTTGDGKYAVAVYAPSMYTNTPRLMESGAYASVIDLATGKATPVAAGVQLAYDDPGCGVGDTAVLSRALGSNEQQTQLIDVNAATARATAVKTVHAQVTNVFPRDGADYGVVGSSLARIGTGGSVTKLVKLAGETYSAVPTDHGVDIVSAAGGSGIVQHWTGQRLETLGRGRLADLQLFPQAEGGDLLVGDVAAVKPQGSGMRILDRSRVPDAVSRQGGLTVGQVVSQEVESLAHDPVGSAPPTGTAGRIEVSATATHSSLSTSAMVLANGPVATDTTPGAAKAKITTRAYFTPASPFGTDHAMAPQAFAPGGANPTGTKDNEAQVDLNTSDTGGTPTCLVPRNSPSDQALQPTPAMVEWAVDQAVHGDLNVQRPSNYLGTGQAAFRPQAMFPPVSLDGPVSGRIPAQVELGILAQESNFDEATWHAVPGDSGNPLIADYYGTAQATGTADDPDVVPNYSATDCGYGIGQVTDRMSSLGADPLSNADATAVGTDYGANIAASVQILGQTWNQLATMSPALLLNGGNPSYIENWYLAMWAYNSGVHPQSGASANEGHYGVGWFNNPANPSYPANRTPFNDNVTTSNDAAQPQLWSYEEKVMGWIEHPQLKGSTPDYVQPNFGTSIKDPHYLQNLGSGPGMNLPGNYDFCSPMVNECSSSTPSNPCPTDDAQCWWSNPITWIPSENSTTAATEKLSHSLGSSEPAMVPQYPADCPSQSAFYGQFGSIPYVVTDLNDPAQNTRGCSWTSKSDGKFTIRLGDNISVDDNENNVMQANPLSAQIDLHQAGAGFLGHFYFSHTYDGTNDTSTNFGPGPDNVVSALVPAQVQHKVTGVWTPTIPYGTAAQTYEILAAIPDHGANAPSVTYHIDAGDENGLPISTSTPTCQISQASQGNRWVYLGNYTLAPGADVWLDNMVPGAAGTNDIAFSTVVFVPTSTHVACGTGASLSHS
jgi:hypothetical protein